MKTLLSQQKSIFGFRPPGWFEELKIRQSGKSGSQYNVHRWLVFPPLVLAFVFGSLSSLFAQTQQTFTTPGTFQWEAPAGTRSILIECWGGGANGIATHGGNGGNYMVTPVMTKGFEGTEFPDFKLTVVVGATAEASSVTFINFPNFGTFQASGGKPGNQTQTLDSHPFMSSSSRKGGQGGGTGLCNGFITGGSGGASAGPGKVGGNGAISNSCAAVAGGVGEGNGGNNDRFDANARNGKQPGGGGGSNYWSGPNALYGTGAAGLVRITYWCSVSAGSIGNAHTIVNPQERIPDFVTSTVDASVPSGQLPPYKWEERTPGSSVWTEITGATGASYSIPALTQTTVYRRSITACSLTEVTNEVTIKVLPLNGNISGKVRSANGVGVQGIELQARKLTSLPGSPQEFVYSATTGPDGAYSIPVYFGDKDGDGNSGSVSTDFTIIPVKANHDFAPVSLTRTVSSTNPNRENVDFTDNTAYSITGKVFQTCNGCLNASDQQDTITSNLDGVTIFRKGVFVMNTAYLNPPGLYGQWASTVTDQGIYSFRPKLEKHGFLPDSQSIDVQSNVANVDFEDTTQFTISGRFGDGCKNYIGIAQLEFSDVLLDKDGNERPSEFRKRVFTLDDGTYSIKLPARKYRVSVVGFTMASSSEPVGEADLKAFFNNFPLSSSLPKDSLLADISSGNDILDLLYQRPPSIQLLGFDNSFCGSTPLNFVTLEQGSKKVFQVNIFQGSPGLGCPLSDDSVTIVTNLLGDDQNLIRKIALRNGIAKDSFIVGNPNTLGNFNKLFSADYTDTYNRQAAQVKPTVVVLGVKSDNASSFATTSPQLPLVVLHDPPGDKSYSFWETNKTIESAMRFSAASSLELGGWLSIKLGVEVGIQQLALSYNSAAWGILNSSVSVNSRNTTSDETIISTTTTQNISTSADEDVTGDGGDLFMGAALNLLYSRSTEVKLDSNCQLEAPKRLMIAQKGFATQYVYTDRAIRTSVIPTLRNFVNNPGTSEAEKRTYENQIKVWEQVLANNDLNKARAAFDKNISFYGSSGAISNSTTTSTTKSNTIEFDMEIDATLAAELGFEIAGNGVSGGFNVRMRTETGSSKTRTTTTSTTIGYTLDDNDALDNFSVNVRKDPVYSTPVFQTVAGQSSCPPEKFTQPRDEIQLTVQNPVLTNVPANSDAIFELKLGNLSIDPLPRVYNLSFEQASNPFGATISIGGSVVDGSPIPFTIDPGDEVTVTVNVKRNPANSAYTYEGLKFTLSDACGNIVKKSAFLSASFAVNCSPITMAQPEAGWLCNQSSNDQISVLVKDYNLTSLTQIELEYAKVGSNNWRRGFVRLANQLVNSANGTTVNWDVSSLADGDYYLRIKLVCSGGITYTQRIQGTIDRKSPLVLGNPQPTDGLFSVGDEISYTFDEDIRTTDLNLGKVALWRVSNGQLISTSVNGSGAKMVVTPGPSLQSFVGEQLRMTVQNVFDKNGNAMNGTDTLYFLVESFEPATGNNAMQLTVNQPSIVENATDTLLYEFSLPQNVAEDVQVNFTIGGDATVAGDYTFSFSNSNGLNSFDGISGRIIIPKNKKSAILRIHPKADGVVEATENLVISLAEGGDYEIGANFTATGSILDNSIASPTITGASQFCPGSSTVLTANHPMAGNPGYSILWSNGATTQSITVSQPGSYTVFITQISSGLSGTSQAFVLTHFALPNTNAGADFSLAQNSGNYPLGGSPSGGTWSGTGVTGTNFNSNQALGTYPLVYCFTSTDGCTKCDTVVATITSAPLVPVATPTFNPGSGTYANPLSVSISCATQGAQIYYTTNGNTPQVGTSFTLVYSSAIQVNQSMIIRAMAVKTGSLNSAVAIGNFTITNPSIVATPVISPATGTYTGSKLVTITTATPGAEIYYTTSGNNPVIGTSFTKLYTGAFWITGSATIRAMGVKSGITNSAIAVSYITITNQSGILPEPVSISPDPGDFQQAQTVVLTYGDPTVTIYYTLDGTEPDPDSPNTFVYTGPFVISNSATVVAIAMKNGVLQGLLEPAVYNIGVVTATAENQQVGEVLVYPNPSPTGIFQIKMAHGDFELIHYQVTTLDGKLLQESNLEPTQSEINLGQLSSGIYLLKIKQNDRTSIHRLIRQ